MTMSTVSAKHSVIAAQMSAYPCRNGFFSDIHMDSAGDVAAGIAFYDLLFTITDQQHGLEQANCLLFSQNQTGIFLYEHGFSPH
jgi:hypothetical protein